MEFPLYSTAPPAPKKHVRLMFAASEPIWIDRHLTPLQYTALFISLRFEDLPLLYIWPQDGPAVYSCEHRQWTLIASTPRVSQKFFKVAASMTGEDKLRVRRLVHYCIRVKLDLGENE